MGEPEIDANIAAARARRQAYLEALREHPVSKWIHRDGAQFGLSDDGQVQFGDIERDHPWTQSGISEHERETAQELTKSVIEDYYSEDE